MSAEKRRKPRHRSVPYLPETRQFTLGSEDVQVEVRSIGSTDGETNIRGQAVVWGAEYEVVDAAGAFTEVMSRSVGASVVGRNVDCRLLADVLSVGDDTLVERGTRRRLCHHEDTHSIAL